MLFKNVLPLATLASLANAATSSSSATTTSRFYSTIDPSATEIAEAASKAETNHKTSNVQGSTFERFVVIWLENTDFDKAAESDGLSSLAKHGITLDNYWALTHPSEPNYLASVGGDYFALDDDRFISLPKNVSTIVDLLNTKNISWGEYQEHLPYTGFQGFNYSNQETFANDYVRKHNPLVLYESITDDEDNLKNIKNFTSFYKDLEDHTLPQWSFITPNMTNDGHDTNINVAADWSKNFLEPLLSNDYFMKDTLVLLTFDENENYALKNKVFALLLGGVIPDELKGTVDSTYYDHYSEISSVEANWDLPNLGRHDAFANVFKLVADKSDIVNEEVDTTYQVNNHTYIGYLNDDTIDLPAPNVSAINKNGKPVLDSIKSLWSDEWSKQQGDGYFTATTTTVSTGIISDATTTGEISATDSAGKASNITSSASNVTFSNTHSASVDSEAKGAIINTGMGASAILAIVLSFFM
ncbi:putative acid phosphatase [Wickerhamomyces ciferrii]|uniref:acid phosphatase n=1 Tax=Wickerhamomyces ciferrii (strain ATCC 14091 / BCRC 22168 / CBS 111 / JCM 3599 / NBRC 0793 / NRRL Y-1031 F-60-10) TaxID=1206466 RepID=K0KDL4_WICCF|nr:putative acid phosphatase [Wickerhamomyces ciferrii]CCH41016.1 putative acid phosphatase [Wickerhamomyces ciferrii]